MATAWLCIMSVNIPTETGSKPFIKGQVYDSADIPAGGLSNNEPSPAIFKLSDGLVEGQQAPPVADGATPSRRSKNKGGVQK